LTEQPKQPSQNEQPNPPRQSEQSAQSNPKRLLPVVVVTGLHQEQRRQAVRELIADSPAAIVLHHDLSRAAQGEVVRRVWDHNGTALMVRATLTNDCPCCALREDLLPYLKQIAQAGQHRLAVVELWGGSEPQPLVETIAHAEVDGQRMDEFVQIKGVVAAVDPQRVIPELSTGDLLAEHALHTTANDERTVAESLSHQVEYANVIALAHKPRNTRNPSNQTNPGNNPTDPANPDGPDSGELRAGLAMLRQLRPTAHFACLGLGELTRAVTAAAGFDTDAAAYRVSPALAQLPQQCEHDGVTTLLWRRRQPLHPERLHRALEQLVPCAQRSRGRFWLANRPDMMLAWDAAGASLTVEDCGPWLACLSDEEWDLHPPERRVAAALEWDAQYGDRVQLLSFTAQGLDADGISELLDSCLLTDDELAAGERGWKSLPDAFEDLLDPVGTETS
jgi:G3E family GTPase